MVRFGDAPSGDFNRISEGMAASEGKRLGTRSAGREIFQPGCYSPRRVFASNQTAANRPAAAFKIEYECPVRDRTPNPYCAFNPVLTHAAQKIEAAERDGTDRGRCCRGRTGRRGRSSAHHAN